MDEQIYPANLSPSFFGRQTEIAWLLDRLAQEEHVLLIFGPRYIGKSALLLHLANHLPNEYVGVYVSADQIVDQPGAPVLSQVAALVRLTIHTRTGLDIAPPKTDTFGVEDWNAYIHTLSEQMEHHKLVLLVDEADQVTTGWLADLIASDPKTRFVLAATQRTRVVRRLSHVQPTGSSIHLGVLDTEGAELVVKNELLPQFKIDPWAIRRIIEITSHHPHYTRLFCQQLLDCCTLRDQIVPPDIEEGLELLLGQDIPDFGKTWADLSPTAQSVLTVFSAMRGQGGIATQYDLEKAFRRYERPMSLEAINEALEALVQADILEKLGTNSYRFYLELYRLWIQAHYSPQKVLKRRFLRPNKTPAAKNIRGSISTWLPWIGVALIGLILLASIWKTALSQKPAPTSTIQSTITRTIEVTLAAPTLTAKAAMTPTAAALPTRALTGYDLLLMSRQGAEAKWQLYALNSTSGDRRRLSDTESNERTPKWSPDGTRILFVSDRDGNREVYVMEENGDNTVNLSQHKAPDWQATWSPDGQRVVFSSHRDDNWEVYIVNIDGTGLTRLTEEKESDFSPTWSPDGSKLLFASRRYGDADLFVMDMDTQEVKQLTDSELDEYDPAWSPDGQWIAFVTLVDDQSDVFVMRADGTQAVNLTHSAYANDFQPVWTQYAEELLFVSFTAADGDHDLFRMRRDGRELARVTDDEYDNVSPCWRYIPRAGGE